MPYNLIASPNPRIIFKESVEYSNIYPFWLLFICFLFVICISFQDVFHIGKCFRSTKLTVLTNGVIIIFRFILQADVFSHVVIPYLGILPILFR